LKYPRLSEQAMRRLAQTLRTKYSESRSEIKKVSRDQVQQLEQLLNTLSGSRRTQLLSRVRKETPELLNRLTSEVVLDGAIAHAPNSVLNEVFLELDPNEGAAYLQAQPDREAILKKLSASLGQSLLSRIKLGGAQLDFVESESIELQRTRNKLNAIMKSKSLRGEVNLRSMNEAVVKTP
jgi:flagellar motor switch protein FliG